MCTFFFIYLFLSLLHLYLEIFYRLKLFYKYYFHTFALSLVRESGANPEKTRCCKFYMLSPT